MEDSSSLNSNRNLDNRSQTVQEDIAYRFADVNTVSDARVQRLPGKQTLDLESLVNQLSLLEARVNSLEHELDETKHQLYRIGDIQAIQRLLDRYTALHDEAVFDLDKRLEWERLFAADGVAVYPFGTHRGMEGKGAWAFGSVSYFERCQLLSSNFDISFLPVGPDGTPRAQVRSNCIAQWVRKKNVLDDHFDEGGFYYWTLVKAYGTWHIEHVHLTITWTTGEDPSGVGPKEGKQGRERGEEKGNHAVDDQMGGA